MNAQPAASSRRWAEVKEVPAALRSARESLGRPRPPDASVRPRPIAAITARPTSRTTARVSLKRSIAMARRPLGARFR